ncbi:MAG: hypothetical protein IID51_07115 [Proteobacteria bacterium]|nr:hypothetical protein [Pseudomonadota bacterium]
MVPQPDSFHTGTGYAVIQLPFDDSYKSYEEYRKHRVACLQAYALVTLQKARHLQRVIAIGFEPPMHNRGKGGSQDLVFLEPGEWTSDLEKLADDTIEKTGIFSKSMTKTSFSDEEYSPGYFTS